MSHSTPAPPPRGTIVPASAEVIEHHAADHERRCPGRDTERRVCPCCGSIAVICLTCEDCLYLCLVPFGPPCLHAAALLEWDAPSPMVPPLRPEDLLP